MGSQHQAAHTIGTSECAAVIKKGRPLFTRRPMLPCFISKAANKETATMDARELQAILDNEFG
jgi:hypothetical protein